jgi:hypothetical protein
MGRAAEKRIILQLLELLGDGVDDLLAAMAGIDVPQPPLAVDILLAVDVVDDGSFPAIDDQGLVVGDRVRIGEGMPLIFGIPFLHINSIATRHPSLLPW